MSETASPPGRSRGNYFAGPDAFKNDVKTGVTRNRAGRRVLCLTDDFLLGFREGLEIEVGPALDTVLKSCGRSVGERLAKRLDEELAGWFELPLRDMPLAMFEATLVEALSHHGWGLVKLDLSRSERGIVVVDVANAIYASLIARADKPVDSLLVGLFAGIFSHVAGRELDCVQTSCKAAGGETSRFVVSAPERLAEVSSLVAKGHDELVAKLETVRSA